MSRTRCLTVDGITSVRWHEGTGDPSICVRDLVEVIDCDDELNNPMYVGPVRANSFAYGDICESCWLAGGVIHGLRLRFSFCRRAGGRP